MKAGNFFLTVAIPIAILLTMLVIETAHRVDQINILKEKKLMQSADQIKRKGYDIEHRPDAVCGYYYWRDDLKWNTDSYCRGRHGTVKTLPDSLTFFHRRMIEEVDKIAERKGYGGW